MAGQGGDQTWSIEIDGFVPHLDSVDRVLRPDMTAAAAQGTTVETVDETLRLGILSPNGTDPASGDWDQVRLRLLAALALEAVGIGSKAIELAIEYAGEREQFGKKIGTIRPSPTRSSTATSGSSSRGRSPTGRRGRLGGRRGGRPRVRGGEVAGRRGRGVGVRALDPGARRNRLHLEHPLHRYYKRALWIESALGYGREHRARVADAILA